MARSSWRNRLEVLGLITGASVLVAAVGYHLFAIADEELTYSNVIRQIGIVSHVTLALGSVLALLLILLPRVVDGWPKETPSALAVTGLVIVAAGALLASVIGVVAVVGGLSEIGVDEFDREVATTTTEVWAYIFIGLGSAALSIAAFAYALIGVASLTTGERRLVNLDVGQLQPMSAAAQAGSAPFESSSG